jgi:hypothetical protein
LEKALFQGDEQQLPACDRLSKDDIWNRLYFRGTNNSYQLATDSPLARLYSTSTLERHHLNQALLILNLEGNRYRFFLLLSTSFPLKVIKI